MFRHTNTGYVTLGLDNSRYVRVDLVCFMSG